MLLSYSLIGLYVKEGKSICAKNELICTSLNDKKGSWRSVAKRKIYQKLRSSGGRSMSISLGMTQRIPLIPTSPKGRPFYPPLQRRGFYGPFDKTVLYLL
jgi:hypothetical protein